LRAATGAVVLAACAAAPAAHATLVTYTIDPLDLNSIVGVTGDLRGETASAQFGSTLTVTVSGTITANRVGNTLEFVSGGRAIVQTQSGNFGPGPDGDPTLSDDANFALTAGGAEAAIRNLEFHPLHTNGPVTLNAQNRFSGSSYEMEFLDGDLDFAAGNFPFGSVSFLDDVGSLPNGSNTNGQVTMLNGVETITIPVRFTVGYGISQSGDSEAVFTGLLTASGAVPEPGTAALLVAPLAAAALRRRRRRD
jgi:hypothetical protein